MQFTKLNVGSRDELKPEPWLNIDIEPHKPRSNFTQMDVFDMPKEWAHQFDEVHAVHVLEHVNRNRRQEFVNALARVTKPGGSVFIEVPDFQHTIKLLAEAYDKGDRQRQHIWTTSIYGKQRSPGDQHCWGFDTWTLTGLGQESGMLTHALIGSVYFYGYDGNPAILERCRYGVKDMISPHYKQEPILLYHGKKRQPWEMDGWMEHFVP